MFRLQHNVGLTKVGRKDNPKVEGWRYKYDGFPIERMKVGYSFIAEDIYDYGKTITIKNRCRVEARKLGISMKFSVREWQGKIRVWRIK